MRMTVLGGCGAWPAAGQACSGYLVEHDGFRLLLDPATLSTGRAAGEVAAQAGARQLLLTHLWPGLAPDSVAAAARRSYPGPLAVATAGATVHLD